jgi:hypothetical protein
MVVHSVVSQIEVSYRAKYDCLRRLNMADST